MNNLFLGLALISVTSLANGVFSIPLRYRRRHAVENTWLIAFAVGYLIVPQIAICWLVPSWPQVIAAAPISRVLTAALLGAGWGVASLFFSQAIPRLGVSLGYALIMGLTMVVGSVIPLASKGSLPASVWGLALAGIATALVGVALSARAGMLRQRHQSNAAAGEFHGGKTLLAGLALAIVAGLLSAFSNIGYDYAQPLVYPAPPGVSAVWSSLIPWLPLYWGGTATVVIASAVQLTRNRTWDRYRGPAPPATCAWRWLWGLCWR